jgi:DNA repair protein SbcD/Mre11
MIRFIHTADIHFGMENYGRIDPKTGIHSRLLDFEKALNFCIDYTLENNIDFFLFSGDAYKTINPSPTQQRLLMRCFLRLYKAGIPIIIIVGNHDNPLSFGKATTLDIFGELPIQGFHVISKPTSLVLETKNGPIQIVGIPWPSRTNIAMSPTHAYKSAEALTDYIAQSVSAIIQQMAQNLDHQIPAVLAGHLTVSSGVFSGSEKRAIYGNDPVLLPSQLAIAPFDYVALGHLHRYQNLNPNGYPAIVYSGSIERVDFGERKEDKGFCVVTIENKGATHHEFIKTPMRPFIQIEVKLKPIGDQTQQILEALMHYPIKDAIIKILYHVPAHVKDSVDLQKIVQACAQALYLVSITPIKIFEVREKRTSMNIGMDFETVLAHYFESKTEYKDRKDELIRKTLELHHETCQEQDS